MTDDIKRNKPLPRSRRKNYTGDTRFAGIPSKDRRDEQVSRRDDTVKNIAVTLYDIDRAIFYYFQTVVKPHVIENDNKISVPVIYGNPERWVSSQKQGFMRDEKGKIITPIIMFKRNSISKDDNNQIVPELIITNYEVPIHTINHTPIERKLEQVDTTFPMF